jgi:isocitrate/isopropylmalate dehydrogenase
MEAAKISQITIPYIPGDGIGPEVMSAAQLIIDHAVITYNSDKDHLAGKSAGNPLLRQQANGAIRKPKE